MKCPRCQAENREGARFCRECGAGFGAVCSSCGAKIDVGNKFCDSCGAPLAASSPAGSAPSRFTSPETYTPKHLAEKILTSKSALEGERKQVTVLFADLKGSMELLADRDPEEARKFLDPVLERMMEAVHHYEGTVNQVMGDGIMALFGAPIAQEDHAVRACYAALRMQESVRQYADGVRCDEGVSIQIRVGVNSGDVVVRSIGSDLRMDYTAVGQTTHLAARLEQLATPGSIVIAPATLRLAEGYVAVKPMGPINIKGMNERVAVYEVSGAGTVRTRLQRSAARGFTRFVGRDAELEQLQAALEKASGGYGQVVALVGEPGVGKSRLFYEFVRSHCFRSIRDTSSGSLGGWLVLESGAVSYGKATPYLSVIDLLKGYFKIQNRDDLREIREKVTGKLLTLDESLKPMLPALLALLDLPVDDASWKTLNPGQRRQQTLDAVKRLLLREAREQPLLVIFEDLHWVDGGTQALLDGLVDSLGSARLLLLVNYRPEYQHAWGGKTYYSQMRLDTLPTESAAELLEALLGDDSSLAPLKRLLVRRGNPFFLEETVWTLVETKALEGERGRNRLTQPVQAIQVPPTVQSMLAARIDRLRPDDKRLLQVASVIGKDVPFGLLQAIAELPESELRRGLDRLQAAEFLYETGLYPDLEHSFKHALTHEVTYSGLLRERRRELHARIVYAIETLHRDRLGEEIERLAQHAHRGELWEKAVDYLRRAGVKAAGRSALQEARAWFEQALGTLEALPVDQSTLEQAFEIRLELRPVLTQLGEVRRTLERLREAESLAERLNDDRRRGRVCAFMANVHTQLSELDEALATGTRALAIARHLGDLEIRIVTTTYLEIAHYFRGEHKRVVELATDNLAALPADWVYEYLGASGPPSVIDRSWLVMSLAELGSFAEAAKYEAEAIQLAAPTHHAYTVGQAHRAAGMLHLLKGDWPKAQPLIERWTAAFRTGHVVILLPLALASSAWVLAQLGDASEALNRIGEAEESTERLVSRGLAGNRGWTYHTMGRASLLLGRLDEARRLGDLAIEYSPRHPGSRRTRCTCWATWRPIPTGSTPIAPRPIIVKR